MISEKQRIKEANSVTVRGLVINTALSAAKFAAGIFGRSAAMVADAVHSLSDSLTDLVVLAGVKLSSKPADKDHAYGHGRFETLATLVIAAVLFAVGWQILYKAVLSVRSIAEGNVIPKPHAVALWTAVLSIIVKEWLYRYTLRAAQKIDSATLKANAWHHRSDALSSIGTLCGIAGAYFLGPRWTVLDPLAAIVVSFFIFQASWQILKETVQELLDASLGAKTEEKISALCLEIPDVQDAHHIKTRKVGSRIAIELHVHLPDDISFIRAHELTEQIEKKLKRHFGPGTFITVHPEPGSVHRQKH